MMNAMGNKWLKSRMFILGLMMAASMAPLHWWPLGVISLLGLIQTGLDKHHAVQAKLAWFWGYGFYMGSLYWVGHGLWVDAEKFAWFWPVVFLMCPAILAIYTALMMGILVRLKRALSLSCLEYCVAFALMWGAMEWIQGHAFTGFPWLLVAYMWGKSLSVAQMAAYVGTYGLTLVTILIIAVTGHWVLCQEKSLKSRMVQGLVWCVMTASGLIISGMKRLYDHPTQYTQASLRCVQPGIPQKEKISPQYAWKHWAELSHLAENAPKKAIVIFPEAALPWCMTPDTQHLFPECCTSKVLIGGDYRELGCHIYTGLLSKCPGQWMIPLYAKKHLVPFGEYLPVRSWLERIIPKKYLHKITPGLQDFSPGKNPHTTICIPELPPFRCLICYESIFPGTIRMPRLTNGAKIKTTRFSPEQKGRLQRTPEPQWILNITNDAWFGQSWGPYQHFVCAQFRAIEEGLPLVRVANTGMSAIIDPLGRILQSLPLGKRGVLDGALPLAVTITPYGRYQDRIFGMMMGVLLSLLLIHRAARYFTERARNRNQNIGNDKI